MNKETARRKSRFLRPILQYWRASYDTATDLSVLIVIKNLEGEAGLHELVELENHRFIFGHCH
jgi:hypothetical protein